MNETESETPVIFTWADREGSSWWLAVFIFLSFLLHSAAFFLFQGKDPASPRMIRTAPLVQIISATNDTGARSPESDALLQWIAMHDPSLIANVQTVEPKGLLEVPYRASFLTVRTQPLGAPPESKAIQLPPARDPLALIRSVSPAIQPTRPALAPQPTQMRFSPALDSRAAAVAAVTPATKTTATVQATIVLTGVNGEGEPRFAFIQQSCDDKVLDAAALTFIRTLRFAPSGEALQWGTVTMEWGDDAIAPATPR